MLATVLLISSCLLILSSVDIATAQRNGDLRLARYSSTSSSYSSGRLEIYIRGQWGTVCDDSFSSIDARVACRQLGFSSGSVTSNYLYGSGSGRIWLDDVGCSRSESCLLSCSNRGIGVHDCSHSEDVAISCSGSRFTRTDCSRISTTRCTFSQFRCDNGQCVSSSVRCNGVTGGCSDGSDERRCSSCRSGAYRCSNRQCIRSSDRCDRTRDCTDGSDEIGCSVYNSIVGNSIVGIAVGVPIAGFVLFVVIPIVIVCVVIACVCQARRRQRTVITTTIPAPTAETTTVVATSQQQAAYTQSYPAAGTEKQAPPPAYAAQPIEMSAYPPPGAYPPQGGNPPQ